jgi:UDP-glucose 4-epimerase
MKVLITGGAGFIGSHLVSKLVKLGYDVTVIDNLSSGFKKNLEDVEDKIKVVELDVCSEKIADYSKGQDVIFHLAAIPDPQSCDEHIKETFKSNVEGTFNVLFSAAKNGVKKLIFMSTAHLYGEPKYLPIDESHPTSIYNY